MLNFSKALRSFLGRFRFLISRIFDNDLDGLAQTLSKCLEMTDHVDDCVSFGVGKSMSNAILTHKTSDTLFVLGSGPSINLITKHQWQIINKSDSIAFNNFAIHPFIPTFYLYQSDIIVNDLLELRSDYENVCFLLRSTSESLYGTIFDYPLPSTISSSLNTFFISELAFYSKCNLPPSNILQLCQHSGLLSFGSVNKIVPKLRSSISLCLSLSFQLGYEKVVLCGCDMIDGSHFWDHPIFKNSHIWSIPGAKEALRAAPMKTFTNPQNTNASVPLIIEAYKHVFEKKHKSRLYIGNSQTILNKLLPVYEFDD